MFGKILYLRFFTFCSKTFCNKTFSKNVYRLFPQRPQNLMFGGNLPPHRRQIFSTCLGKSSGEPEGKLLGEGFGKFPDCVIFIPQRPQNFENGGSGAEHLGQGKLEWVSPSLIMLKERLPHFPQNFTPWAKRALQFVQATIPGITLACVAPLLLSPAPDGEG